MSNNLPYKMSWENYKKSEFYKNPQNPSSEIRDIYKLQSEIERKKFNVKYFNCLAISASAISFCFDLSSVLKYLTLNFFLSISL